MQQSRSVEIGVGVFVLIGLLAVGYLTIRLGKLELLGDNYYALHARFTSVGGLKTGAYVELAGVPIGQVKAIRLDPERLVAEVDLKIHDGVELPDDSIAAIRTSGLIGDRYIEVSPGGSLDLLADGKFFTETQSAVDLTELVGKYVFGGVSTAAGGGKPAQAGEEPAEAKDPAGGGTGEPTGGGS